ncbi:MAG TPA: fused MFS/spermidine synthase [Methylomirabilota bacterium]|nr:fused MFS/spermidine synthase [Methylomirabilota bacterium]
MSQAPTHEGRWVRAGLFALLIAAVAAGFSPPVRFQLLGRDYARWIERYSTGQTEAAIEVRDGTGAVPYILPGPADAWAGGIPHRFRIEFEVPRRDVLLRFAVPDAHDRLPPHLVIAANGHEVGRLAIRRGSGQPPPHEGRPPREYRVTLPAAALEPGGRQTVTVTNVEGSWVTFSALAGHAAAPTFALASYRDASPPPAPALVALVVGLLALFLADRRPLASKATSLGVLAAGLGFVGFLHLASRPLLNDWHVVLTTHRGIWLLLAFGFVPPLVPQLPRPPGRLLLMLTTFLTGVCTMVLEIVGMRLLSPFFGYSVYLWGALFGVTMAGLAAGYYAGGWLADRVRRPTFIFETLLATGVAMVAALAAYPFVVQLTMDLPLVVGSLLATLLLLFLPMAGLSLVPPFAIRLVAGDGAVGLTAGRVYALSTLGSLAGTFATVFFLITTLGPQESWMAASLLLVLIAIYAVTGGDGRRAVVAVHWLGMAAVFAQPWIPEVSVAALRSAIPLHTTESEYSHLEVIEVGKAVHLIPQLRFSHTIYDEDAAFEPIISYGLLPSYLTEPRTMLHLGMGGGTLARVYLRAHPAIRIDGVDIDAEMIRLGKRFLGLRDDPRLRTYVEDGRAFLFRRPAARYDVVVCDLFQGGVFIPYYTLTREFFELTRERLHDGGVLALFVARPRQVDGARRERYHRLFSAIGNTLATVFPSVFVYPVADIGHYFVATRQPESLEPVRARLARAVHPEVAEALAEAVRAIRDYQPDPRIPSLTDDLAPVDQLIYDAFFRR